MLEWGRLATAWRYLKEWSWVEVSVERIRFSRIAKNLAMLGLWNDGTLVPLNRITNGRGQRADLRKIFGRMQNMEAVTKAGEWLRRARYNQVRARARSRNSGEKAAHSSSLRSNVIGVGHHLDWAQAFGRVSSKPLTCA